MRLATQEQVPGQPPAPSAPAGDRWSPRIVALVCHWCSYAGADLAGTTRRPYPASVRAVRVPCTGRIDPLLVVTALTGGADGVLLSGCHPGDCHYVQGNLLARRRFTVLRALLEVLGVDPRRFHVAWVSASEGVKWARVVEEVTAAVREAGPSLRHAGPEVGAALELPPVPPPPRSPAPSAAQEAVGRHVRELAAALLREGTAEVVVGYTAGSLPGQMVPAFATSPEEAALLDWNDRCLNNLAVYLPTALRRWDRVAVVVKGCDARTAVGLLQEHQAARDRIVLLGVSCPGVWPEGRLALKCYACDGAVHPACDWTIVPEGARRGPGTPTGDRPVAGDPREALLATLASWAPEQRWAFWQEQFARCLRCYACRAVCPLCYCAVCVAERNRPQAVPVPIEPRGNTIWNAARALHLAGRCAGCDECARVCPAEVRLDLLNRRLALEVERRFGYRSGEDPQAVPPLDTFRPEDPEEFVR